MSTFVVIGRGTVAFGAALLLGACIPELVTTMDDKPPAEVGGVFKIGGFSFGGGAEKFGYTGTFSGDEQALREQARKFDQAVWQGALIGALAGTAIVVASGGEADDAVGGAIVGAGLGAIVGAYIAQMQRRYASKEDQLAAMITDVRTSNRESAALIASVRSVIAEDRRRLAAVQAKIAQGQASESDLKQERGRAWSNRRVVEKAALGARDQYRVFEGAARRFRERHPMVKTGAMEQELGDYRRTLDGLDRLAAGMAKA